MAHFFSGARSGVGAVMIPSRFTAAELAQQHAQQGILDLNTGPVPGVQPTEGASLTQSTTIEKASTPLLYIGAGVLAVILIGKFL